MTYTPEQLRDQADKIAGSNGPSLSIAEQVKLLANHADALEELARVKKAISESCDEQRGEYFGCRRAERAEAALAESERKCERGCFCLMEMMQAYERRVRSLCAPEEIEKRPWECAEYNKAAEYLRAVWKPDAYRAEAERDAMRVCLDAPYNEDKRRRFHAEAALAECRAKLEVDPRTKYDGIDCRDETIRMLEKELEESARLHGMGASREAALQARLAESERKCERLKVHAEAMAVAWEKLDFDDGESEDAMEESVFDYRAEFKEES